MGQAETAWATAVPLGNDWRDRMAGWTVYAVVFLVSGVFLWILSDLVRGGIEHLSWSFIMDPPQDAGRGGGIESSV